MVQPNAPLVVLGLGTLGAREMTYASDLDLDGLKKAANHAVEVIDPDGADEILGQQLEREEANAWDATRLEMHRRGDGMVSGTSGYDFAASWKAWAMWPIGCRCRVVAAPGTTRTGRSCWRAAAEGATIWPWDEA